MSSSPRVPRPVMRSYYLRVAAPTPYRAIAKTILALIVVGASATWGLSALRKPELRGAASSAVATPVPAPTGEADAGAALADSAQAVAQSSAPRAVETVTFEIAPSLAPVAPAEEPAGSPAPTATAPAAASAELPAVAAAADPPATSTAEEAAVAQSDEAQPVALPPAAPPPHVRWVVDGGPTVNLRAEASTSGRVLAMLPLGTVVQELPTDELTARPGWRRVVWNTREGWISAGLLRLDTARLDRVPIGDQGFDRDHPVQPGVYPLKELSTGRPIVDNGGPVYVDEWGSRVGR
jgi:hypothetical protein